MGGRKGGGSKLRATGGILVEMELFSVSTVVGEMQACADENIV